MSKVIYWFRNDLRIEDNPSFMKAVESGKDILPVYVFDESRWKENEFGIARTGSFRTQFLLESLNDLKIAIEKIGGQLTILKGNVAAELGQLVQDSGAQAIYAENEHTSDEVDEEQEIASIVPLVLTEGKTLFHPDDLPYDDISDLPDIFTQFRKHAEKRSRVREELEAPQDVPFVDGGSFDLPDWQWFEQDAPEMDDRRAHGFKGGTEAAWERLNQYFWDRKGLSTYKETRNGLIGEDYSSKFSPWLALGCISPRQIYWEIKRYESEVESNKSTYWLIFELIWRDYFRFVSMKYGDRIFWYSGISAKKIPSRKHQRTFEKWMTGETADPFVNANMKELLLTGWMSNRGRQNVASYLVHDLNIDWRMGASWFEKQLLDYDPASNYGNWIYVAGVGNDPRPNRKFQPKRQAEMDDGKGAFQDLWNR